MTDQGPEYGGFVYKFCRVIGLIFVFFIGTVTHCMAMEDMPAGMAGHVVVIEDNELYGNSLVGIRIRGRTPIAIRKCKVYSNGMAGIVVDRGARVTVAGCDVFKNGRAGINIGELAPVTIEDRTTYKNNTASIQMSGPGKKEERLLEISILNNRIYMNNEAGIRSMPQRDKKVDLRVVGNDIYENRKAGVRVENNTKLTAKGNDIHENGTLGIVALESVIPPVLDIYQNSVRFNVGPGIHIINGITGRIGIRNNWIYNNLLSGIACGLVGDPTSQLLNVEIINNTIVSNGSSGQGAGIRNDSKGKVTILNNVIAYNYVSGIMTKGCRGYSYNLLFANGYVSHESEDTNTAVDSNEVLQYAGCLEKGKGDLISDPLFVDPDNYDFHLTHKSPAIDAGKEISIYDDISFPPSQGTNRNDMGVTGGPYATE
ncbi:MAG: right-handed parallel beta-helix repeat-containing protein [Desulfobacterales bacterium]|nr:MAG: right-handed parallel beta-helix repeat-containing protein [Desulfobacterales bacterium]